MPFPSIKLGKYNANYCISWNAELGTDDVVCRKKRIFMTTTFDNLLWMNDLAVSRIMGILEINTVEHRVPGSPSSRQEMGNKKLYVLLNSVPF
jgi:hypothetical protein